MTVAEMVNQKYLAKIREDKRKEKEEEEETKKLHNKIYKGFVAKICPDCGRELSRKEAKQMAFGLMPAKLNCKKCKQYYLIDNMGLAQRGKKGWYISLALIKWFFILNFIVIISMIIFVGDGK